MRSMSALSLSIGGKKSLSRILNSVYCLEVVQVITGQIWATVYSLMNSSSLTLILSLLPPPELLSQLSGVRRSAGGQLSSGPSASQLQQLQMQLQLERQQAQAARQQLETARNASRGSGRANAILNTNAATTNPNPSANHNTNPSPNPGPPESSTQHNAHSSQFLLSRYNSCYCGLHLH